MKRFVNAVSMIGLVFYCTQVTAQSSYVLTNQNTSAEVTFTNDLGTAALVGTMIVFEGQLSADTPVTAVKGTNDYMLASLQLLTQIKLFDELPESNDVGMAQGAVAAKRDAPESADGMFFVWGSTNTVSPVMEWVPLYQSDGTTPFAVTDGSTNYITFVFNYTLDTYQVFIGNTPSTQTASKPVTSLTMPDESGINSVSLQGSGGLETVSSAAGVVGPLSASIGFSVYATANGILIILDPADEQGSGWFKVYAFIDGTWVEVGKVQASGAGHYEIQAYPGLLQFGQSYAFKVIDELGNPHELSEPVAIQAIKMESVTMEADVMVVTFNTESARSYQVISAETLDAAVWSATAVYAPVAGGEWNYTSEPFTAAGATTTIRIPRSTTKGFFKIRKTN